MKHLNIILFILTINVSGITHARSSFGYGSSYQINQYNQMIQNMNQIERMNQNINQMNQMNQMLEMNHLERMNDNMLQRHQLNQHINDMNQMNQLLNMEIMLQKKYIKTAPPVKNNKPLKQK
ncbi:hypothetical protein BAC3_02317 [uncultured bacterium]|nr:hypothetical protein BAC3_02317 [uncultured bacterium]